MSIVRRMRGWFGAAIAVLGLAMALWCIPDWGFLSSEISHYHVYCSPEARDAGGDCRKIEIVFPVTVFTVDVAKQEVFSRMEGQEEKHRETGCSVIDRSNWKCVMEHTLAPSEFGFTKGRYFERHRADGLPATPDLSGAYVTVPKWRYVVARWLNF